MALSFFFFCLSRLGAAEAGPRSMPGWWPKTAGVAPGGTITVALEEKIAPGWHTYWKNPGDAGAPTEIEWTLPPGWKADAIQWPRPKRLPVGPLMDYGYEGTLWLLTKTDRARRCQARRRSTIKAAVSWLVCKKICIPEEATPDV